MSELAHLLRRNKAWADAIKELEPDFFRNRAEFQTPELLWIGCSDARVPANQLVDLPPGEIFVHRNIANQVIAGDLNCQSVIQYAVDVLKVKHIIVCGHIGCGGVKAAFEGQELGLIDGWLAHIKEVIADHQTDIDACKTESERLARLCELNVVAQVRKTQELDIVKNARLRGQALTIHGWIYDLATGVIKDLEVSLDGN